MDVNPILNPKEPRLDASKITTGSITADHLYVTPSNNSGGTRGLFQFIEAKPLEYISTTGLDPAPITFEADGSVAFNKKRDNT